MKKLMIAVAVAAMAGGVFADKAAEPAKAEAPAKVEAAAPKGAAAKRPARPVFDRAKFEARMKERQAERRAKVAELLKGAGVAEDKIPALTEEIEKAFSPRPPRSRRAGKAAGPQRPAPAAK